MTLQLGPQHKSCCQRKPNGGFYSTQDADSEGEYVDLAHRALVQMQLMLAQYPLGFGQWLQALAYALSKPREIATIGDPDSADTQALLSVVRDGYRPFWITLSSAGPTCRGPI